VSAAESITRDEYDRFHNADGSHRTAPPIAEDKDAHGRARWHAEARRHREGHGMLALARSLAPGIAWRDEADA